MNDDEHYLNLLAIFQCIYGGVFTLLSLIEFPCIDDIGFYSIQNSSIIEHTLPPRSELIVDVMMLLIFILQVAFGILIVVTAHKINNRRSRIFCIVIATIECIFWPIGTFLGIFTIIVLRKKSVIKIFESDDNVDSQYDLQE